MPRIAVIPGDGIGTEVTRQAVKVMERAAALSGRTLEVTHWDMGAERYLRTGVAITEAEFRALAEDYDAILLGALGDPRVADDAHLREILLGLRFRLDLYVNYRPNVLLDPRLSPLRNLDGRPVRVDIFRENTEGAYVNLGGIFRKDTPDEVAIQEDLNTRRGVERIVRAAFEYARMRGRPRVTMVDKANALPAAGSLWRRVFTEVGAGYPEIEQDAMFVDAAAMDLVRRPERFAVVVTSNLFGDILSDLAAAVTGGLGLAPSANVHPGRHALFEPVHGSAPDIAGRGVANPLAAIRCVALLFEYLGDPGLAERVENAAVAAIAGGKTTPDLGGSLTTDQVGDWVAAALAAAPPRSS
ncbi:MAG: isocitrate/isopropylmalate dehydrogenase family protein [Gemmatimonadetes bacterium]|nr:isocitrate/isopropylmalate dehydrogenase family protein [Gemmatimonadota bacterium]